MTDREKAIVSAYTGVCMLKGDKKPIFYSYVEGILGRPVTTHEIVDLADEIKEKSKDDFMKLCEREEGDRYDVFSVLGIGDKFLFGIDNNYCGHVFVNGVKQKDVFAIEIHGVPQKYNIKLTENDRKDGKFVIDGDVIKRTTTEYQMGREIK
jgi:hypothetical protein